MTDPARIPILIAALEALDPSDPEREDCELAVTAEVCRALATGARIRRELGVDVQTERGTERRDMWALYDGGHRHGYYASLEAAWGAAIYHELVPC